MISRNLDFLNHPFIHFPRIISEFFSSIRILHKLKIKNTIVFVGSSIIPSQEKVAKIEIIKRSNNPELISLSKYYREAQELAFRITKWSRELKNDKHKFIIATGGGGGIMEAACRGAREANGYAVGFNILLPSGQQKNPFITDELNIEFHYFFIRKFWLNYLAKALIIFPGGFGTIDELMGLLIRIQTKKLKNKVPIVIYGQEYWNKIINFNHLARFGTILREDLKSLHFSDSVDEAFKFLTNELTKVYL